MGQEYNQSGARKLILIHFQSLDYQCFKTFIILIMESLSLRTQLKTQLLLGFFISGSRAQLVGLRLLDIKKQTKCNQLGAYPPLRDHTIIPNNEK